jgi:hypothetical protein
MTVYVGKRATVHPASAIRSLLCPGYACSPLRILAGQKEFMAEHQYLFRRISITRNDGVRIADHRGRQGAVTGSFCQKQSSRVNTVASSSEGISWIHNIHVK